VAILVGTSGWSYEDWVGRVYPAGLPPAERLPFLAERHPTVEVNSTFYRTPPPATVHGWVAKVKDRPGFELSVKAPQTLTQDLLATGAVPDVARYAREWDTAVPEHLAAAGRLGAVLLQLAPNVLANDATLARLEAALDALAHRKVAVEFRNPTWVRDDALDARALALLDGRDAALVALDGPSFPVLLEGGASHAYVRFHGRNADAWFRGRAIEGDAGDPRMNRYDYAYRAEELRPWATRLADLATRKPVVRVYFNNHPYGKAHDAAALLDGLLAEAGSPSVRPPPGPQRRLDAFREPQEP